MIYPTASKQYYLERSGVATNGTSGFPARSGVEKQTLIDRPCVLKSFSMSYVCDVSFQATAGIRIELCDGDTPIAQVFYCDNYASALAQTWSVLIPGNGIRIGNSLKLALSQENDTLANLKASGITIMYQG